MPPKSPETSLQRDPVIEEIAKVIYAGLPFIRNGAEIIKPAWVENGNSIMQEQSRRIALNVWNKIEDLCDEQEIDG